MVVSQNEVKLHASDNRCSALLCAHAVLYGRSCEPATVNIWQFQLAAEQPFKDQIGLVNTIDGIDIAFEAKPGNLKAICKDAVDQAGRHLACRAA